MQCEVRLTREMTVSRTDFLRTLPSALNNTTYAISGDAIRVEWGNRRLQILLSRESSRRLGAVSLPVTQVEFIFSGCSEIEVQQFFERFDMCYRRGGGQNRFRFALVLHALQTQSVQVERGSGKYFPDGSKFTGM
jgi:hypothetical protein